MVTFKMYLWHFLCNLKGMYSLETNLQGFFLLGAFAKWWEPLSHCNIIAPDRSNKWDWWKAKKIIFNWNAKHYNSVEKRTKQQDMLSAHSPCTWDPSHHCAWTLNLMRLTVNSSTLCHISYNTYQGWEIGTLLPRMSALFLVFTGSIM